MTANDYSIYFLSARTDAGDLVTVSRCNDDYVICCNGYPVMTLAVSATSPKRLDAHVAGFIAKA